MECGEKGTTVWLVIIHRECPKGVIASAANGNTACGEGRSARSLSVEESAMGVTTDRSSNRVRELDLCWFDKAGPVAIAADRAERPSSGARVTRMIRPNRTEVLLFVILT